jgi:hypothetical protein
MKLLQLPIESLDQVSKLFGIAALVLFGLVMLFLGWLKYKDSDSPKVNTSHKRTKRKAKRK